MVSFETNAIASINVNDLFLYQQVALYLICMIANPIFINTFVVFVRLYWFEKRFQSVVMESQRLRRTRTKGSVRNMRPGKDDGDLSVQEAGLGRRKIQVINPGRAVIDDALHKTPGEGKIDLSGNPIRGQDSGRGEEYEENEGSSGNTARSSSEAVDEAPELPFRRDITFADEVHHPRHARTFSSEDPVQPQISKERNIAFLENQRNPKDKGALYIPGPRDFDRGLTPQQLADEANNSPITPRTTGRASRFLNRRGSDADASDMSEPTRFGRSLTFDTAISSAKQTFGRLSGTRTDGKTDAAEEEEDPMKTQGLRRRGRRNSFASFVASKDEVDGPLPYLSYQPTIGRNSTFVNLTEEQREELGGIEYRSLKTLAVILCSKSFVGLLLPRTDI